jgi:hypothetical protein
MIQSKRGTLTGLKRNPAQQSKYDSLLERDYMRELEHEGGVVKWTKDHGIKIPYRIFGIIPRNYLPDFLVTYADGSQELHETKGAGFLFWLETHAKRAAADAWCKLRGMKYKFIENSRGAMFANNNALHNAALYSHQVKKVASLNDL